MLDSSGFVRTKDFSDATFPPGLKVDLSLLQAFESKAKVVIRVRGIIIENPQETPICEARLNLPPVCTFAAFAPSASTVRRSVPHSFASGKSF